MSDALKDGLSTIASFVPKLLLFLIILVAGYFIAKIVGRALSAILERVGFDRAVERGGVKEALQQSRYDASDVVGRIIFYALFLFVLQLAFGVFPTNPISDLLRSVINFLPLLVVAIIIIVVAAAIAAAVRELVTTTLGGLSYGKAVANGASALILGIGFIAGLNQINIATSVTTPILITVLATIGGILVIGVGGGLIRPMAERWEGYLTKAEAEVPKVRESARNAPALREQARQARERYRSEPDRETPRHAGASRAPAATAPGNVEAPYGLPAYVGTPSRAAGPFPNDRYVDPRYSGDQYPPAQYPNPPRPDQGGAEDSYYYDRRYEGAGSAQPGPSYDRPYGEPRGPGGSSEDSADARDPQSPWNPDPARRGSPNGRSANGASSVHGADDESTQQFRLDDDGQHRSDDRY